MDYLVDTNVICEVVKRAPNQGVLDFLRGAEFLLPSVVFAELTYGAHRLPDTHKEKAHYLDFIERLKNQYQDCIVPLNLEIAEISGCLRAKEARQGRILSATDALIAATSLYHKTTLVTRNIKDFAQLNIALFNPFL